MPSLWPAPAAVERSALRCSRPQVLALNVSLSFHVAPFPSRYSDVAEIELLTDTLSRWLRGPFVTRVPGRQVSLDRLAQATAAPNLLSRAHPTGSATDIL